ncbi:MAG: hypothetical protein IJM25_10930 [Eubacterium sp.]|nr:hypothetical protein [Eubacterium sp.]
MKLQKGTLFIGGAVLFMLISLLLPFVGLSEDFENTLSMFYKVEYHSMGISIPMAIIALLVGIGAVVCSVIGQHKVVTILGCVSAGLLLIVCLVNISGEKLGGESVFVHKIGYFFCWLSVFAVAGAAVYYRMITPEAGGSLTGGKTFGQLFNQQNQQFQGQQPYQQQFQGQQPYQQQFQGQQQYQDPSQMQQYQQYQDPSQMQQYQQYQDPSQMQQYQQYQDPSQAQQYQDPNNQQ